MAVDSTLVAEASEAWSAADRPTRHHRCCLVFGSHGLPVATAADRLSQVEDGLHGLLAVAEVWPLAADSRRLAWASSPAPRQAAPADGDDHGQSIDSHGRGRRRTRLRRRKKDHRPQATPGGRYLGFDLGGRRARRLLARSRRRPFRGDGFERALPAAEGHLRRQRLRPPGIARLDSSDLRLDPANGAATLPSPGLRRPAQPWIVERTFSWIIRHRRNARDYERNTDTSETMIYITMISLMVRRLATQK